MSKYASNTTVSMDRTIEQIRLTIERYGYTISSWVPGWDNETKTEVLMFKIEGRLLCYRFPMLEVEDFLRTPTGRKRARSAAQKAYDQAKRQRWRAVLLSVKSRLEEIESGITTFEQAFLGQTMLPNGQTVAQWMEPQLAEVYLNGRMPPLLPAHIVD